MGRIYLVRHAQASFGLQTYDRLSELGKQQAPHLDKHFNPILTNNTPLIFAGDMQRQQDTATLGFPGMEIQTLPGLNEFDHQNILAVYHPQYQDAGEIAAFLLSQPNPKKAFQLGFEAAMQQWMQGHPGEYVESWSTFAKRCTDALQALIATGREKDTDVIAVTSGGVIAAITGHILGLSTDRTLDINWVIANTAVTSLLYRSDKVSLAYFNNFHHLPSALLTYR
jgi:broad specificity phosphatase PhoE